VGCSNADSSKYFNEPLNYLKGDQCFALFLGVVLVGVIQLMTWEVMRSNYGVRFLAWAVHSATAVSGTHPTSHVVFCTQRDSLNFFSLKNAVFWDVAPCRSCVSRRFGGTYRLHFQGRKIRERGISVSKCLQTAQITPSAYVLPLGRDTNFHCCVNIQTGLQTHFNFMM
jgi:hypothetical protein